MRPTTTPSRSTSRSAGRHQRSATDASHADQQPDAEARKRVQCIDHASIIANLQRLGAGDNFLPSQRRLPDELWDRLRNFLESLSRLPCWVDGNLSTTVFGPKQNLDFWDKVFQSGKAPTNVQILAAPLDLNEMIRPRIPVGGRKP
jgi:hypothetical protein